MRGYKHLTTLQVAEIRALRSRGVPSKQIQEKYGVSRSTITRATCGQTSGIGGGRAARRLEPDQPPIYRATLHHDNGHFSQVAATPEAAVSTVRGMANAIGVEGSIALRRLSRYTPYGASGSPVPVASVGNDWVAYAAGVEAGEYLRGA